jgi:hypothetical protein
VDYRTRRNREDNRNKDFAKQTNEFADAYMEWDLHRSDGIPPVPSQGPADNFRVQVVDIYSEYSLYVQHHSYTVVFQALGTMFLVYRKTQLLVPLLFTLG